MTKVNVMLSSMVFAEGTTPTERVDLFDEFAEMIEYGAEFDAVFDFTDPTKIRIKNCTYSRARYMIGKYLDMKPSELKRYKAPEMSAYDKACAEGRTCFSCQHWESGYHRGVTSTCKLTNKGLTGIAICKDYTTYTPHWMTDDTYTDDSYNYSGI